MEEDIEQEFPFFAKYYRYLVYRGNDRKPIAKFNSQMSAQRYIELLHEDEKNWEHKSFYRLVFNGKTQITL